MDARLISQEFEPQRYTRRTRNVLPGLHDIHRFIDQARLTGRGFYRPE
jgi:hypothetical protein